MTKLIIAGCRHFEDYKYLSAHMNLVIPPWIKVTEVVCGKAPGADTLGERWAIANNIPVKEFPADWDKHKRAAGPIRNSEMAEYADALVAFWDGKSTGTKDMIDKMRKKNKWNCVIRIDIPWDKQYYLDSVGKKLFPKLNNMELQNQNDVRI